MLSQEFSSHGLQFFKRKKSVTHVSVSRPHHLNLEQTPVSDSIRNIVTFVVDNQNCTRRMILDKFAPEPDKLESAEAPAEGDAPKPDTPLSPERTAILSDLHWLVHQGHVVEYANGQMEIAPKPQPPQQKKKKPRPAKKPKAEPPVTGGTSLTSSQTQAEAPSAEETKPAEGSPTEPEASAAAEEPPTEPTEPEASAAAEEPSAAEESPAQDDSSAGEAPAKVAE